MRGESVEQFFFQVLYFLSELGYFGIAIGLMIEVIPSEIVLAYGGYMISIGKIGFFGAVLFGVIGGLLAQLFLYWLGYYGGRPMVLKYGKYILIKEKHIHMAEQWFQKYGVGVIFFARFIPIVRHAISIPAGISKMSMWRFTVYTTLAMIPWSIFFLYLGYKLGTEWQMIKVVAEPYLQPVIIGMIVVLALYIAYSLCKKK